MSTLFDNPEYPTVPAPPTDTLADSVVILLALNVVQRLVGFARAVLFCRWLDPGQLGLWDMAFSFLVLASPLSVLAIPGAFGRYFDYYRLRGQTRTFLRRTIMASAVLAMVAFAATLALRSWLAEVVFGSAEQGRLIAVAAGSLLAVTAFNLLVELFTAMRNIRLASWLQLVNSVAFAVLGLGLLAAWQHTAESVLAAYGGSCLIAAVWAGWALSRVWRSAPKVEVAMPQRDFWNRVAPFAGWILLGSVLMSLFGVLDRYMIIHFSNASAAEALDAVGNYHASRVVPLLLISLAVMFGTMITPHLSHDWELGRRDLVVCRLRLFLKVFGFALFVVATAVLWAAPLLFDVAFRGKYPVGLAVLPWTLIFCTWFSLLLIAQNHLLCAEKGKLVGLALLAGIALNVPLNLLLLPRLGLPGAVLATTAANALSLWLICRFNARLGFRLDNGARLIFVLPLLLCLGPWPATLAIVAVAAGAVWSDRLLTPDEKRQVAQRLAAYGTRFGLRPKTGN
jgi:polysaccharide transporter, PST family